MASSQTSSPQWRPGLDGPDILSPRSEIEDRIAELEQMVPGPERDAELKRMQGYLETATERGGIAAKPAT